MKKKKWFLGAVPLLLIVYLGFPVVLQVFSKKGYNKKALEYMDGQGKMMINTNF